MARMTRRGRLHRPARQEPGKRVWPLGCYLGLTFVIFHQTICLSSLDFGNEDVRSLNTASRNRSHQGNESEAGRPHFGEILFEHNRWQRRQMVLRHTIPLPLQSQLFYKIHRHRTPAGRKSGRGSGPFRSGGTTAMAMELGWVERTIRWTFQGPRTSAGLQYFSRFDDNGIYPCGKRRSCKPGRGSVQTNEFGSSGRCGAMVFWMVL